MKYRLYFVFGDHYRIYNRVVCTSLFNMSKDTMKAVVFKGPYKVAIEDRPVPKIQDQTDIIVKVDKVCWPLRCLDSLLTCPRQHYAAGMTSFDHGQSFFFFH